MTRLVLASLLLGALCLLGGYSLYLTLARPGSDRPPPFRVDFSSVRGELGHLESAGGQLRLTLDDGGRGMMVTPIPSLPARDYPIVHMQFDQPPGAYPFWINWRTNRFEQQMAQYQVAGGLAGSLLLPLAGVEYWSDTLLDLAVVIQGDPRAAVSVTKIELLSDSPGNRLLTFYSNWRARVPWTHRSINNYSPLRIDGGTPQPVPALFALFLSSALAYGLFLWLLRSRVSFDRRVLAGLFLMCWLVLDLVWQGKLLQQLDRTRAQFAGKTSEEKLLAGPDAPLVRFMQDARARIGTNGARVFVVSSADYEGMRAAYYLYPLNVFWERGATALPANEYLKRGDYIVMVLPATLQFDTQAQTLQNPDGKPIKVELLGSGDLGSLFRVI